MPDEEFLELIVRFAVHDYTRAAEQNELARRPDRRRRDSDVFWRCHSLQQLSRVFHGTRLRRICPRWWINYLRDLHCAMCPLPAADRDFLGG